MKAGVFIAKLLTFGLFNPKWRCNACGKETFEGEFFCSDCIKTLPYVGKDICDRCGRALNAPASFCSTCKGVLTSIDKSRSVFRYEAPISGLIRKAKYDNGRYILDYFSESLSALFKENFSDCDVICSVPMSEKRLKERKYNQSAILAESVAEKVGVPFIDCMVKTKETERQATLKRSERLKNLIGSFKVSDRKAVRGKSVVVIDDVTTTGATGEAVAAKLKKAGAIRVYLLTVASVSPKDGY